MDAGRHDEDNYLFRGTFENAAVGIAHVGLNGEWPRVNARLCEIVGYPEEELRRLTFQDITYPDDVAADLALFEPMMRGEGPGYQMEKRYFRRDGAPVWVNLTTALQHDDTGRPLFCISVVEDITARKQAEAHLRTVVDELNHRVRNTLTVVQSIANRSFPDHVPVAQGRRDFVSWINALAAAHALLVSESWMGARIEDVAERALAPHRAGEGRSGGGSIEVEGPSVWLAAKAAVSLSMALGKLATNAVKHGALGVAHGRVTLRWTAAPEEDGRRRVEMTWTESGGPPVGPIERRSFGTMLLEQLLPAELRGTVALDPRPEGMVCHIAGPAAEPLGTSSRGGRRRPRPRPARASPSPARRPDHPRAPCPKPACWWSRTRGSWRS